MEGDTASNANASPAGAGARLRAAREAQGLDLAEIAVRTRIPQRHLEAIENADYSGLPSSTYAIGFAKAYARAVGADEVAVAHDIRGELGTLPERSAPPQYYPLEESGRMPSRGFAWVALVVALLVLVGVGLWYGTDLFRGTTPAEDVLASTGTASADSASNASVAAVPAAAPAAGGQVTLVASETVWLRVRDRTGKRLFEKEMAPGERFDVPRDAQDPVARTGRPDRVQVLINGSQVAPLGTGVETVDVGVSAEALQARSSAAADGGNVAAPTAQ
ncbi:helix-turn-helix domain-containing protein [Sphingomonas sp. S2-65]|uniref:helix-turn-helix domain-containing protein n=1 Tax=Sphingomonas sp. S2-65 TaxID=2903960 RepID=UPI001F2B66E0|nr:helix-turn-helix domain-containing protein [Sphingomonas sp. S2-65]UYY57397.1 helix-turn-helix domain-containing protein [Sphingomonas sp. S2-65]